MSIPHSASEVTARLGGRGGKRWVCCLTTDDTGADVIKSTSLRQPSILRIAHRLELLNAGLGGIEQDHHRRGVALDRLARLPLLGRWGSVSHLFSDPAPSKVATTRLVGLGFEVGVEEGVSTRVDRQAAAPRLMARCGAQAALHARRWWAPRRRASGRWRVFRTRCAESGHRPVCASSNAV